MPSIICRPPEGRSPRPPSWYRESELSLRKALVLLLPTAYTCSPCSRSRLANRAKSLSEDMSTKFVESTSVHQVHHVNHQAHIRCVLPVRAHELLMRDEREADELSFPAAKVQSREVAIDPPHACFTADRDLIEDGTRPLGCGLKQDCYPLVWNDQLDSKRSAGSARVCPSCGSNAYR